MRSLLTSIAFLLVSIPAIVVAGGYVPQARAIAGFGRLLMTDLPWLGLGAAVAAALALLALRLGGGRFTRTLALGSLGVLAALVVVGVQWAALAGSHGASYDLLRQARPPGQPTRTADQNVAFAEVDGQALHADIWMPPVPAAGSTAQGLRTGVLFIHGGGFTVGWLGARPDLFENLSNAGYVVVDVEYRLAPPPRWQDASADILCALGWLQRDAETFGIDPARVVVMGDSAGGNLALVAAYGAGFAGSNPPTPSCDVTPRPPLAVVAVHPVADLAGTWTDLAGQFGDTPFPEIYTGGTPTQVPERYEAGSVARLVRAGLPPTLLYTGVNDSLIHVGRIRELAASIVAAGSPVELVEVPFADHGFDSAPNGFGAQLEADLIPAFIEQVITAP